MSQSFPEVAAVAEAQADKRTHQGEEGALAVSADDFSALEERILRAVELVKSERSARNAAEDRAARAEAEARRWGGRSGKKVALSWEDISLSH